MNMVQDARIRKTKMFKEGKANFLHFLQKDIDMAKRKAKKEYLTPCFRLNLTSDISWERYGIIQNNPDVQFYDYTKNQVRAVKAASKEYRFPENYHLTFSKSEDDNTQLIKALVGYGLNVAVVFNKKVNVWEGMKTIDGDKHDLRFLDGKHRIVALNAKGDAVHDNTGFTVKL